MADESVAITPGAGADIAVDTVGGKHYQRVKLDLGGDGAVSPLALGQTTKASSIPVTVASDDTITAALAAIQTSVQLIDNAVSGNGLVTKIWDGTDTADVFDLANSNPLAVQVVDANGTAITSFSGSGGTADADGTAHVANTTSGTPVQGVYESAPTTLTDLDLGTIGVDSSRRVKVSVDASTIDVAHDAADSGNPVKIGTRALSALPTAVATSDRANGISDLFGRLLTAHIDPGMQTWKSFNATTAQTGVVVWDPAAGKKIAITNLVIGTYGTTAGRLILFFDDDTTFVEGTDQTVFKGSFAPSTSSKPGAVMTMSTPIYSATADYELRITTDAAMSVDLTVYGYEF